MQHHNGELWPGVVLADDVVIGQVTAQNILRRAWQKAELGYWIAYPYQGQGHATRAVSQAVEMMTTELELHRAEGFTQMDNLGSQHVLRNNGFVPCGIVRSRIFTAGPGAMRSCGNGCSTSSCGVRLATWRADPGPRPGVARLSRCARPARR